MPILCYGLGMALLYLRDEQIDREIAAAQRLAARPTSNSEAEA